MPTYLVNWHVLYVWLKFDIKSPTSTSFWHQDTSIHIWSTCRVILKFCSSKHQIHLSGLNQNKHSSLCSQPLINLIEHVMSISAEIKKKYLCKITSCTQFCTTTQPSLIYLESVGKRGQLMTFQLTTWTRYKRQNMRESLHSLHILNQTLQFDWCVTKHHKNVEKTQCGRVKLYHSWT
jgi:hypothetical protein